MILTFHTIIISFTIQGRVDSKTDLHNTCELGQNGVPYIHARHEIRARGENVIPYIHVIHGEIWNGGETAIPYIHVIHDEIWTGGSATITRTIGQWHECELRFKSVM